MKYVLHDLGKPCERLMGQAFVNTSEGNNLLVRGGWTAILRHLESLTCSFIGKIATYWYKTKKRGICLVSSHNIKIIRVKRGFEFRDANYGLLLKHVRRFPNTWIPELDIDVEANLSISTMFLKEKGFDLSAQLIEEKLKSSKYITPRVNVYLKP